MTFKDLFSKQSVDYSKFRPTYPAGLFPYLAKLAPSKIRAWDAGTGNGQAALGLADYFQEVIATDASPAQIKEATHHPNVLYAVAPAEDSGLSEGSVDLVTVAQAFHWFKHADFYKEVRRVARPGAVLAVWSYGINYIEPKIDERVMELYEGLLGPFWDPERRHVEDGYKNISIPFTELMNPKFEMTENWSLDHFIGYLGTWSALKKYEAAKGESPLPALKADLEKLWPNGVKRITWPLSLRTFRL